MPGRLTARYPTIRDELNVRSFDTGFPVDFGLLRRDLGPEVEIKGGPRCSFLMAATPAEVREGVRRILSTGDVRAVRPRQVCRTVSSIILLPHLINKPQFLPCTRRHPVGLRVYCRCGCGNEQRNTLGEAKARHTSFAFDPQATRMERRAA